MQWFDTLKEDNTEKYLVNITSDVMLDNYMKDMSGKKRNNLKIALENFTENPEKYPSYAQLTGALERAKEALEELKEMSKRTEKYVPTMEKALTELGKGNITNMLELLNKEVNRQNTDFIKALVKKHKLKILQYSKKLEEDDKEKLMKVLQEKYNFAPAEESKYIKRRNMSSVNIEKYLRYVIFQAPSKARKDLLPDLGDILGSDYSKLPKALLYIIKNPSLNYEEGRFEKKVLSEDIGKKKAIQDLKNNPVPTEFSRLKTLMDAAKQKYLDSDARDKQNKIDRAFMDSLTADDKKMFALLASKKPARMYSMSVQDYRDLENLEDDALKRYGFKDENEFNTWLDNEAVETAWEAIAPKDDADSNDEVSIRDARYIPLLSRLFADRDEDVKATLIEEFSSGATKDNYTLDNIYRRFKDIIIILDDLDDLEKSKFSKLWTKFKSKRTKNKDEVFDEMMAELTNNGHYTKIRNNFKKEIDEAVNNIVETNYQIKEKGVIQPLAFLHSIGAIQVESQ
tara:strand:+ start:3133 stop:4671 length:1539 start_codon:yes stop_codon:yes gene_type:complete